MSEMIYNQFFCFMIFIITGIVIGILFDIFRILRRSFRTSNWMTYLQDILFWVLTGGIILFSIFQFNYGELRIYVFLGIFIGGVLYILTISRFLIQYSVKIITTIKRILWIPIGFLIKTINHIMMKPIHFFVINIRKNTRLFNKTKNMTKFKKKERKKN